MTRSVTPYQGGHVVTDSGTSDMDKLLDNFGPLLDAAAALPKRIYAGGSTTPNLANWVATFSGGGTGGLVLSGNDVFLLDPASLLSLDVSADLLLDGAFDFSSCSSVTHLNLNNMQQMTVPPILAGCGSLEFVELGGYGGFLSFPIVAGLSAFQLLAFSDMPYPTASPDLSGMVGMIMIDFHLDLSLAELPTIPATLTQISYVDLSSTAITNCDALFDQIVATGSSGMASTLGQPYTQFISIPGDTNQYVTASSNDSRAALAAAGWTGAGWDGTAL
jgi:hypothetical protein